VIAANDCSLGKPAHKHSVVDGRETGGEHIQLNNSYGRITSSADFCHDEMLTSTRNRDSQCRVRLSNPPNALRRGMVRSVR